MLLRTWPSLYWGLTPRPRLLLTALFGILLTVQYLWHLDATGVLDPDEPRYAAIGRAMAVSNDWVTPRLWGSAWFEKPALLYWMTAIGTRIGLNRDLAGRLPVALLSLLFLAVWFTLLRREIGETAAAIGTVLLATSAAWFAFSSLCLTDLPMSVFFSLAVAIVLRMLDGREGKLLWFLFGASLGMATLAKALVPLVLALPLLWFVRGSWRRWWLALAGLLVVAGPWYGLVMAENGTAFIRVLFIEQQFSRLYSDAIQHVRPFYFYVPVLLGTLFPWTLLLLALRRGTIAGNAKARCLLAVVVWGFVFFSASQNKLAGYLLPLLPSLFALIGLALAEQARYQRRVWIVCGAVGTALLPAAAQMVPTLMTTRVKAPSTLLLALLPLTLGFLILLATPLLVGFVAHRRTAGVLVVLCASVAAIEMRSVVYPELDEQVSPRGLWRSIETRVSEVCDGGLQRAWRYGLAFYHGEPIPACGSNPRPLRLVQHGTEPATIERAIR